MTWLLRICISAHQNTKMAQSCSTLLRSEPGSFSLAYSTVITRMTGPIKNAGRLKNPNRKLCKKLQTFCPCTRVSAVRSSPTAKTMMVHTCFLRLSSSSSFCLLRAALERGLAGDLGLDAAGLDLAGFLRVVLAGMKVPPFNLYTNNEGNAPMLQAQGMRCRRSLFYFRYFPDS